MSRQPSVTRPGRKYLVSWEFEHEDKWYKTSAVTEGENMYHAALLAGVRAMGFESRPRRNVRVRTLT